MVVFSMGYHRWRFSYSGADGDPRFPWRGASRAEVQTVQSTEHAQSVLYFFLHSLSVSFLWGPCRGLCWMNRWTWSLAVPVRRNVNFEEFDHFPLSAIKADSIGSYSAEKNEQPQSLVKFDCRGVEPYDFEPRVRFRENWSWTCAEYLTFRGLWTHWTCSCTCMRERSFLWFHSISLQNGWICEGAETGTKFDDIDLSEMVRESERVREREGEEERQRERKSDRERHRERERESLFPGVVRLWREGERGRRDQWDLGRVHRRPRSQVIAKLD